jgi:hypothetical protein
LRPPSPRKWPRAGYAVSSITRRGLCRSGGIEAALESAAYIEEGAQVAIHVLSAGGVLSPILRTLWPKCKPKLEGARALSIDRDRRAVLFDLDGTLSPVEMDFFLRHYMDAIAAAFAPRWNLRPSRRR